jgi:hypothetical protein
VVARFTRVRGTDGGELPQLHRGFLDDLQARVKLRNNRTHVRSAAKNMRKCRAFFHITELNTIPVHAYFAISILKWGRPEQL